MAREKNLPMPAGQGAAAGAEGGRKKVEPSPAARRALAEAEARRSAAAGKKPVPTEIGGPDGPEPTRYGDWEIGGIASDF